MTYAGVATTSVRRYSEKPGGIDHWLSDFAARHIR
jgi:hypothetical protein